jgi:hypothetical protein
MCYHKFRSGCNFCTLCTKPVLYTLIKRPDADNWNYDMARRGEYTERMERSFLVQQMLTQQTIFETTMQTPNRQAGGITPSLYQHSCALAASKNRFLLVGTLSPEEILREYNPERMQWISKEHAKHRDIREGIDKEISPNDLETWKQLMLIQEDAHLGKATIPKIIEDEA